MNDKPDIVTSFDNHETESRARYIDMQDRLTKCAADGNAAGLDLLVAQLDAQLKLEDFLIKFREADHVKIKVWGTMFVSGIVSIITTLLTILVAMLAHKG